MRYLFGRKRSKKSTYQKPKPRKPEFELLEKRWLLYTGVISSLDEALVLSDRPLFRDLDRDPLDVFAVDAAHKQKPPAGTAEGGGAGWSTLGNSSPDSAHPPTSGSAASADNSWQGAAAFASEAWGGGASFAPPSGHSVGASPAIIDTPGPPAISGMNFSGPPNINLTNITTSLAVVPPYTNTTGFSATIDWGDTQ